MQKEKRIEKLKNMIEASDAALAEVLAPTIEMLADIESRIAALEGLEFMRVNPNNKAQMKQTAAGKMYKELNQVYDNKLKIIIKALRKIDAAEDDGLDEFIEAWKNGTA